LAAAAPADRARDRIQKDNPTAGQDAPRARELPAAIHPGAPEHGRTEETIMPNDQNREKDRDNMRTGQGSQGGTQRTGQGSQGGTQRTGQESQGGPQRTGGTGGGSHGGGGNR
jgi:hypothetical protein